MLKARTDLVRWSFSRKLPHGGAEARWADRGRKVRARAAPSAASEGSNARWTRTSPDLLPSGLYRRLRSFTGSWSAKSSDMWLATGHKQRLFSSSLVTYHSSLFFRPSRAIPPIGNWTCGRFSKPQILTLPRRSLTQIFSLSPQGGFLKRRRRVTRDAGRATAGFSIFSPAGGLPRFAFLGPTPEQRPCVFNKLTALSGKPHRLAAVHVTPRICGSGAG